MSYPMRNRKESKLSQLNWLIILLVLALGVLGITMLYSAAGGSWSPWAFNHAIRFGGGMAIMIIIALLPSRLLLDYAYLIYGGCLGLLVLVELIGSVGMGAQRWLDLGFMTLQPSELMKLGLIVALARYYNGLLPEETERTSYHLAPIILTGVPVLLILLQPNLGTAFIVAVIGAVMLFVTGLKLRWFMLVAVLLVATVPIGWSYVLHDYQKQRVMTFLNPEADPLGTGYNIMQSKIAIGSGGLFGKGLGQGSQSQLDFLPEKHTDFIFTMIAEELGFIGAGGVIFTFLLLIILAIATGMRSRSTFGSLVAVGIATFLLLHITINIAMVMGLVPVVGIPLPLLSYGGSVLLATQIGIGLLLNAYVHRDTGLSRNRFLG